MTTAKKLLKMCLNVCHAPGADRCVGEAEYCSIEQDALCAASLQRDDTNARAHVRGRANIKIKSPGGELHSFLRCKIPLGQNVTETGTSFQAVEAPGESLQPAHSGRGKGAKLYRNFSWLPEIFGSS